MSDIILYCLINRTFAWMDETIALGVDTRCVDLIGTDCQPCLFIELTDGGLERNLARIGMTFGESSMIATG